MPTKSALLASALFMSICIPASAQPVASAGATETRAGNPQVQAAGQRRGGHAKIEFLETYDANGDAVVTRAEFDARRDAHYGRADANGDGKVSEDEYVGEYQVRLDADLDAQRERQLRQAHVRFGVLDTDKNAGMTEAEFDASGQRMFSRLDTNGDGTVDEHDTAEAY